MTDDLTSGQQLQAEIQDLLAVTRGMSDGEFSRLVAEIEEQLLRLLVLLRIEETVERVPDAKADGGAKDAAALWSQALIDQLFQEVKGETATSPGSSANGTGGDQR